MKRILIMIILVMVIITLLVSSNNRMTIRAETLSIQDLPSEWVNMRIAHLSDLHGRTDEPFISSLIDAVKHSRPDVIVFTGDLIDKSTSDYQASLELMKSLHDVAPVFFVPGNHEYWSGLHESFFSALQKIGVVVLINDMKDIFIRGQWIRLVGLDDPASNSGTDDTRIFLNQFEKKSTPTILLAHRPELFDLYCQYSFDLVCAGHAHGGQFKIPWLGPIIAPDQGVFPAYTQGPYSHQSTTMIVSRGLGNSIIPFRLNNPPELVVITLQKSSES